MTDHEHREVPAALSAAVLRAEEIHAEVIAKLHAVPSAWVDDAVDAWHEAHVQRSGLLLDDVLRHVLARVAPHIAEHALRTATLQQHEEMIRTVTTEAIERERPKLLAMVGGLLDQATTKKAAAIRAAIRAAERGEYSAELASEIEKGETHG